MEPTALSSPESKLQKLTESKLQELDFQWSSKVSKSCSLCTLNLDSPTCAQGCIGAFKDLCQRLVAPGLKKCQALSKGMISVSYFYFWASLMSQW